MLINNEFERIFEENNKALGLHITYKELSDSRKCFNSLINECYDKYEKKVVVLIDEYDKLILDNIGNDDKSYNFV